MTATVLITRPRPDAERLSEWIEANFGAAAIIAPVMEIEHLDPEPPADAFKGTLLTSRHAVPYAAARFPELPALCVGAATLKAAEGASLQGENAGGDAERLIMQAQAAGRAPLLYLRGERARVDVAGRLSDLGVPTRPCIVYRQNELVWDEDVRAQIVAADRLIVPTFSPRSAALIGERMGDFRGALTLVSISEAAQGGWGGPKPAARIVADHPDLTSMKRAIMDCVNRI